MEELLLLAAIVGGLSLISVFIFYQAKRSIPYIHSGTKTSAWEANLISESRLEELAESQSPEQVLTILEDTDYQPYVGDVSMGDGVELEEVEEALNSYAMDRYRELLDVVPEERTDVVKRALGIIDLRNLKAIVIAKARGMEKEDLERILVSSPIFSEERLDMLKSADSLERLLEYLEGSEYYERFFEAFEERYEEEGISPLVRALDMAYYEAFWEDVKSRKEQRAILEDVIGSKLDLLNITLIFRLKREGISPEKISDFTVTSYRLTDDQIKAMAAADDIKSVGDVLAETIYSQLVQEGLNKYDKTGSLYGLEKTVDEEFLRLCRRNSVTRPFTLAPILSYIYLIDAEIRNLRTVIGLKAEDVGSEEIKSNLIRRREIEFQAA